MGAQSAAALNSGSGLGVVPPSAARARTGSVDLGPVPPGFCLDQVARGHGAVAHPPSAYAHGVLHRVLSVPLAVRVSHDGAALLACWSAPGRSVPVGRVRASLRHQLTLDDDLEPLWRACDAAPGFSWVRPAGAGRVLRAETVFEDLVGVLASARTSWSAARGTLGLLVAAYGAEDPQAERAFPTAEVLAGAGAPRLRACGLGFRAERVALCATRFAADDHARWLVGSGLDDATVAEQMLQLPGVGPFGAATLLALVGRPRGVALDGWATRTLGLTPEQARSRYSPLGRWAGTGAWLDVVRHRAEPPGQGSAS